MVIQHNIPALNSHRNLGVNNKFTSKNLEKLSSGYRINRAADDAAGLAISEKMRGQIRGLGMAEQNTSHAINLIQTAEGALNETHAILQRMRELAVQSSNGTYQDEDRDQITKEFEALKSEIDRIAESTHYNNIKLLDGSLAGGTATAVAKFKIPEGIDNTTTLSEVTDAAKGVFKFAALAELGTASKAFKSELSVTYVGKDGIEQTLTFAINDSNNSTVDYSSATVVGDEYLKLIKQSELGDLFEITNTAGVLEFTAKDAGLTKQAYVTGMGERVLVNDTVIEPVPVFAEVVADSANKMGIDAYQKFDLNEFDPGDKSRNSFSINGVNFQLVTSDEALANLPKGVIGLKVTDGGITADETKEIIARIRQETGLEIGYNVPGTNAGGAAGVVYVSGAITKGGNGGLVFQIGANGGADQRVGLQVDNMNAASIGIKNISVDTIDAANRAIVHLEGAIISVAGTRADLGALQNRLESTMNSLGVAKENLTAAESTIRDVDMAKEMMEFTKNNILVQASQAMLAQANQLPQGVLQLLR